MKMYLNSPCPKCGHFSNRAVTIDAIVARNGKILLVKRARGTFKGFWALPGGYLDWNETVEKTVRREVREETGLFVRAASLLGIYSSPKRHPRQVITAVFHAKASGTPKAGDDAEDCRFFPLTDLPPKIGFDHRKIINSFRRR